MFGLLESIAKAAVGVVVLPVSFIKDAVEITDPKKEVGEATSKNLQAIYKNLERSIT